MMMNELPLPSSCGMDGSRMQDLMPIAAYYMASRLAEGQSAEGDSTAEADKSYDPEQAWLEPPKLISPFMSM